MLRDDAPAPRRPTAVVLATANPHKVEELRAIFAGTNLPVLALTDLPDHTRLREPDETGQTFVANARIKALSYARQVASLPGISTVLPAGGGAVVLADDSGIEIDALALPDGTARPGVISSHYCTDGREVGMSRAERDAANNARVLKELQGVPAQRRSARFVCCMCVASVPGKPDEPRVMFECRGTFEGRIGEPPRVPSGGNGFGYDPMFLVGPGFEKTGAELEPGEKNRVSHRARCSEHVVEWFSR